VICEFRQASQKSAFNTLKFTETEDNNVRELEMFVAYTACNEYGMPMQRHKSLPHGHLFYSIAMNRGAVEDKAEPLFKSGNQWPMRCQAAYIDGRVYAVFYRREREWQARRFQMSMDDLFAE
jgi:hypothetical protein